MNPFDLQINLGGELVFLQDCVFQKWTLYFHIFYTGWLKVLQWILNYFFVNISHIFFARLISRIFNNHILIGSCQLMEKILIYICWSCVQHTCLYKSVSQQEIDGTLRLIWEEFSEGTIYRGVGRVYKITMDNTAARG